jgi:hypothetical protein
VSVSRSRQIVAQLTLSILHSSGSPFLCSLTRTFPTREIDIPWSDPTMYAAVASSGVGALAHRWRGGSTATGWHVEEGTESTDNAAGHIDL